MLSKIISHFDTYLKGKRLLKSLRYPEKELKSKRIVFFTLRSLPVVLHQELFLAFQLAELGAKVFVILDNGLFEHWDDKQIHHKTSYLTPYKPPFMKRVPRLVLAKFIIDMYKHPNIELLYLSDFMSKKEVVSIDELTEVEKKQAISSVRRYFETGTFDKNNIEHMKYYYKSLKNCAISKSAAIKIKEILEPDLFITSHGIYSLWGPAFYYMKSQRVPSIIYGAHAYMPQKLIISDVIAQVLSEDSDWKRFQEEYNFSDEEKRKVIEYFNKRIYHKAFDTKIYYGSIRNFEEVKIPKSSEAKVFGLFPNIIWDGDVYERDTIFEGIISWVIETLKIFQKSRHNLVIRFHPGEATLWKGSLPLEEILRKKVPDFLNRPNIYLISANRKIDTYKFIRENVDVGIVYDGILAMEMPFMGIPVISCAKSRYTGSEFVYEPKSLEEYKSMLMDPEDIIQDFKKDYYRKREELLKYAYWYFFVCAYHLPILDKEKPLTINYRNLAQEDVDISHSSSLKRTIDKIKEYAL